jgi:signal transduction histidine kinase
VLVCFMLVVSIITGIALSRIALRPVRLIQETANRIRSDNLSERIPVAGVQDEISNLARLLNEMFDRLESSFNQIRRFTAEASHELKTPLSLVRLQGEKLLVEGGLTPAQEEAVQMQLEEVARLNKIIEELLFLSRMEAQAVTPELRREDPRRFMLAVAGDARVLAEHRGVRFSETIDGAGLVEYDPKWIRQVLLNLIANALKFSPRGGLVTLTSEFTAETWRVAVEDDGPGVPAEQRERIFERFVRLNAERTDEDKGSGLGLAISRSILGLHRGTIHVEASSRGTGLRVVFEIPVAPTGGPGANAPSAIISSEP